MTRFDQPPTGSRPRPPASRRRHTGPGPDGPRHTGPRGRTPAPLFGGALTAALGLVLAAGTVAAGATPGTRASSEEAPVASWRASGRVAPVRLTLPEPTGPHRIGTAALHLVDRSRRDPWKPARPARELMVQLWYPAEGVTGHPRAPWLSPGVAALQLRGVPAGTVRLPDGHGHLGAPVSRSRGGRAVVLLSHGFGADRASSTALVEDLASHGYVVAAVDHTYDAGAVEFPGGRVETHAASPPQPDFDNPGDPVATKAVAARQADVRFVLDTLTALNRGHDASMGTHSLPRGMKGALDLSRVGMFGHSLGGATSAAAMHADARIKAGANLDGGMFGPVLRTGLDRPFLLIGSSGHGRDNDRSWAALWPRLRGPRLELRLRGAAHSSFTDLQVLLRQHSLGLPPERVDEAIGVIDGPRSVLVQRTYLRAFFDRHLLRSPSPLLTGPSPHWPEMRFVP